MADCAKSPLTSLEIVKIVVHKGQDLFIKDFALMVAISTPNKHHEILATLKKRRDWLWKRVCDASTPADDVAMYNGLHTMVIDRIVETLKWPADDPATHQFHQKIAEIEAFVAQQFIAHNIQHFDSNTRPLGTWKNAICVTDEALFAMNLELHKKYGMILSRS